jgi:hypothetical protein
MYSLNMPVSALRTKMRQEFERHRYVSQIGVVDMLLFQSHAEYQVSPTFPGWTIRQATQALEACVEVKMMDFECSRNGGHSWLNEVVTMAIRMLTRLKGNVELLEAVAAHSQIFPSRGRSECKTSTELHEWFLRGNCSIST